MTCPSLPPTFYSTLPPVPSPLHTSCSTLSPCLPPPLSLPHTSCSTRPFFLFLFFSHTCCSTLSSFLPLSLLPPSLIPPAVPTLSLPLSILSSYSLRYLPSPPSSLFPSSLLLSYLLQFLSHSLFFLALSMFSFPSSLPLVVSTSRQPS